jgi:hypothetical protein
MPGPAIVPDQEGGAKWLQKYELTVPEGWPELPNDTPKVALTDLNDPFARRNQIIGSSVSGNRALTNAQILSSWKKYSWAPSAQLLFDSGYIYFKNDNRNLHKLTGYHS